MKKSLTLLVLLLLVTLSVAQPIDSVKVQPVQFTYLQSTILGLVEGITEFLPISSTGHLELMSHAMGMNDPASKDAVDAFNIVIQGAALLAIIGLYRKRVRQMWRGVTSGDESGRKLLKNLFISFFPAAFVGLLFHHKIKEVLFNPTAIAIALIVGGVLMIILEKLHRNRIGTGGLPVEEITWKVALGIGIAQIFSLWPGTSRSMTTILGAMIAGVSLSAAAEYSFLLALPTLGAASLYDFAKNYKIIFQHAEVGVFAVGMVVSAVIAGLAVQGFVRFLQRGGLQPFGWYRIVIGIIVLLLVSH